MERDVALAVLEREAGRVLELATEDDEHLGLSLQSCPDWKLEDMVNHLGNVYNWAGTIVEGRLSEPPPRDALAHRSEEMSPPAWMADRLERLKGVLAEVPADARLWTFSSLSRTAAFWWRRQAQETLIHRVDAELACKKPITPVEPILAADTVSELFEIGSFSLAAEAGEDDPNATGEAAAEAASEAAAGVADAAGEAEATGGAASKASADSARAADWPASVHLHATDLEGAEWTIDTARRSVSRRHTKADVALRGPAFALALDELQAFGDLDAAERWRKSFAR